MSEHSAEKDAPTVIRFERIGRTRNVPDLPIAGDPSDLDNVAEQAWKYAGKFLGSRGYDVDVLPDGRVLIEFGRFGQGTVIPPAETDGAS